MDRRDILHWISRGAVAGAATAFSPQRLSASALPQEAIPARRGLPPVKITDVKTILTAPDGIRLVVVKVTTSEPGLYGLGCATFTQRAYVVQTAVEQYLKPFLLGRNADEIEDIWQSSYVSSYWRNGPVLFNAMSGVDQALWDIKGKRANMPLYQLLGGKVRMAADLYYHASGRDFAEVTEQARRAIEQGFRYVRVQVAVPGVSTYGVRGTAACTDLPPSVLTRLTSFAAVLPVARMTSTSWTLASRAAQAGSERFTQSGFFSQWRARKSRAGNGLRSCASAAPVGPG